MNKQKEIEAIESELEMLYEELKSLKDEISQADEPSYRQMLLTDKKSVEKDIADVKKALEIVKNMPESQSNEQMDTIADE